MNAHAARRVRAGSLLLLGASSFSIVLLGGCSDARVDKLEETVRSMKSDLADVRTLQAQQSTAIGEMRAELHSVTGKVEEVQHVSVGKTQELEQTITKLQSRVPPPAGVPEDLLNQDDERIAALRGASADMYRQALAQIRTGDFESARATLKSFVEQNPGTAFTDNALFWSGIVESRLGADDRAIVAFSEVFQKYPAEDMVPPALYYLADQLIKMGSKQDAILTLQKLVDEQPKSPFASRARERLAELQAGGGRRRK